MTIDDSVQVLAPAPSEAPAGSAAADHGRSTALFATTAFVGASLLFVVQPLIAKLILPSYGGSATVWSTSSLFFQVLLLLAYGYAHVSTTRLGQRRQPRAHLVLLLLPLVALPVAIPSDAAPAADASPVLWLLRTLVLVIGLPFAVVATTGPLLQRWYSWGDSHRADDPYFLFAASNLGSFGGLLAYPLLIEPTLSLATQRMAWSVGFVVFVVLTATCALTVRRPQGHESAAAAAGPVAPLPRRRLLTWTALAFLPSSLMLGVTAHISTDVAAIPLLWVVPLAIYLATFVVAFSRTSRVTSVRVTQAAVASAFVVVVGSLAAGAMPVALAIGANLIMLALVAFAAHARLAAERPAPEHLTTYFMVIAAGGALGGLLNGMVAPMVLDRVLEYPLALMAVPLLLVGLTMRDTWLVRQLQANRVRAALVVALIALVPLGILLAIWLGRDPWFVAALLLVAVAVGWWIAQAPKAMIVGLVVLYSVAALGASRGVLEQTRTFFGAYTVESRDDVHELVHGTTVHGTQLRDPSQRSVPTTYYSREGPLGDAFALRDRQERRRGRARHRDRRRLRAAGPEHDVLRDRPGDRPDGQRPRPVLLRRRQRRRDPDGRRRRPAQARRGAAGIVRHGDPRRVQLRLDPGAPAHRGGDGGVRRPAHAGRSADGAHQQPGVRPRAGRRQRRGPPRLGGGDRSRCRHAPPGPRPAPGSR